MMNEERRKDPVYEAPRVEVIEVQIERGFAVSVTSGQGVYGDDTLDGYNRP